MYISENEGKRPIAFKDILTGKVFKSEDDGRYYLKGKYGDSDCAVDLQSGKVLNPQKDDMNVCILFPGATIDLRGRRKAE